MSLTREYFQHRFLNINFIVKKLNSIIKSDIYVRIWIPVCMSMFVHQFALVCLDVYIAIHIFNATGEGKRK